MYMFIHLTKLTMVLLDSDPFLIELSRMYERNKDKGSVRVTMKRCTWTPHSLLF